MHEERSGVDWTSFIIPSLTPLSCGIVLNTITIYNEEGKRWNEGNVRPNRWLENCMRLYWMPSLRRFGTYTYVNYLLLYVEYADPNAANTVHQSNSMTPHKWLPVFWSQQVSISFSSFCTHVMNWAAPTVDNVLRWIIVVCNYFVLKEKTTEVYDGISFDKLDNKLERTEQIFFFFFCFWFLKDINDSTTKLDFLFPRDFHLRF